MRLPNALSPWGPYLQHLEPYPEELAGALWPLVQRLDALLGPLGRSDRHGDGDPDGYGGSDRRGNYERLLMTEWLLAEEAPEEFARRAAMGEHAFYQIARRSQEGGRRSIALFDAGPNQWGTPRVAQLAALIVLGRRAAAAGAAFLWGVLQRTGPALEVVSETTVLNLLEARTLREAGEEDLKAWKSRVELTPHDELWLVGGRRLARLEGARGASLLQVRDPLEPALRQMELRAQAPDRPAREISLPLPEEALCVRLLRDPFEARASRADDAARKGAERYLPASNLVWSVGGSKLLARGAEGGVIAYPIPNSPAAGIGKPRLFRTRSGDPVYAAGRIGRTLLAVTAPEPGAPLRLEALGNRDHRFPDGGISLEVDEVVAPPLGALGQVLPLFATATSTRDIVVHLDNLLLCVGGSPPAPALVAADVLAAAPVPLGVAYLRKNGTMARLGSDETQLYPGVLMHGAALFFGYGGENTSKAWGLHAVELPPEESGRRPWAVHDFSGANTLYCPAGEKVVGVMARPTLGFGPGLVVLQADRRHVSVVAGRWAVQLPQAEAEIEQVAVNPVAPWIAYRTANREICVYSLQHEAVLYRYNAEGESAT